MFCRQCGTSMEVGSVFCPSCGEKAGTSASEPDRARGYRPPVTGMEAKGFFESLFDFSFSSLITTKLIKVLYGLSMGVLALGSLFLVIIGFGISPGAGVFALFVWAPLFFLLGVCYTRVMLEIMIVVFRISEHVAELAQQGRIKETPTEMKSGSQ